MKKMKFLDTENQKIIEDFINSAGDNIVVFIGSGISHREPNNLPLWEEVYDKLLSKAKKLHPEQKTELKKVEDLRRAEGIEFFLKGIEELSRILGENVYSTSIRKEFGSCGDHYPPILETIMRWNVKGIITTNIDCLIENAHNHLVAKGELSSQQQVISTFDHVQASEILHHRDWLWKIHGTVDNPDTWIFTLDEYYKAQFDEKYIESLINVFHNTRILFIGYSAKDIDLYFMLEKMNKRFGGSKEGHILLARSEEEFDLALLAEYGIDLVTYGGDENHSNLQKLLEAFPVKKKNNVAYLSEGIKKYREFLIDKTDNIEFKGIDFLSNYEKSIKVSVVEMYTNLYIKNIGGITDNAVSLKDIVESERGTIIKGEPGAGKSTFIQYFIRYHMEKCPTVIPFIISLEPFGRYIDNCNMTEKVDAVEIIIEYLRKEYPQQRFNFQEKDFEKIFTEYECWLFFDGFDEINTKETKRKILKLIQDLYDIWNKCKFVITSRPYALEDFSGINNFQSVYIDMLNRTQMEHYINAFSKTLNIKRNEIEVNGLITKISNSNTLYQLAKTHVMLTFICIIYFSKENIPESRYEILEKIIIWLISSKNKDSKNIREQEHLYSRIAYRMASEKRKGLERSNLYKNFGETQDEDEFIKKVDDTGILVKKSLGSINRKYHFWHYCFQEFLAARYITEEIYSNKNFEFISNKWFDKDFREIIIFVSAGLYSHDLDLMKQMINYMSIFLYSHSMETAIEGAGLLGAIIEEVFPDISFLNECSEWIKLKAKLEIIFTEPLLQISVSDKYNAAVAYGLSGDNRLLNWDDTFIKIESGRFYMGAQKDFCWGRNYDLYATEFESPVKEIAIDEFCIRKYPITVEEYEEFIKNKGYSLLEDVWTQEGTAWKKKNNICYPRNWRSQVSLRNSPVTGISWYEAVAYCNWITITRNDDYIYRLPSEAEWEYVYRICYNEKIYSSKEINCYVNIDSFQRKTPIGLFPASTSGRGVTDMLGNVEEWCADSWSMSLSNCPDNGKAWYNKNEIGAVTRGGSATRTKRLCRKTYRGRCNKNTRYDTIGFRLIREKR